MAPVIAIPIEMVVGGGGLVWIYVGVFLAQHPERVNSSPGAVIGSVLIGATILGIAFLAHRYLNSGVRISEGVVEVRNTLKTRRIPIDNVGSAEMRGSRPVLVLQSGKQIPITGLILWNSLLSKGRYSAEGVQELQARLSEQPVA